MSSAEILVVIGLLFCAYFLGYDCGSSEERRKQRKRDWWRNHD